MVLIGPVFQIAFVSGLNRYINNSNKKRTSFEVLFIILKTENYIDLHRNHFLQ